MGALVPPILQVADGYLSTAKGGASGSKEQARKDSSNLTGTIRLARRKISFAILGYRSGKDSTIIKQGIGTKYTIGTSAKQRMFVIHETLLRQLRAN